MLNSKYMGLSLLRRLELFLDGLSCGEEFHYFDLVSEVLGESRTIYMYLWNMQRFSDGRIQLLGNGWFKKNY